MLVRLDLRPKALGGRAGAGVVGVAVAGLEGDANGAANEWLATDTGAVVVVVAVVVLGDVEEARVDCSEVQH